MPLIQRRFSFSPRLVPTLAAMIALALTLYLAIWQQGRAAEKRELQADFTQRSVKPVVVLNSTARDGAALRYRLAIARGEWSLAGQIFLDNKTDDINGRAGYHVITPLRLVGTDTFVLVNRGWIARNAGYPAPPSVPAPTGDVEVSGMITLPIARFIELSNASIADRVWQNLTIERYRAAMKLDVLPMVLLATATTPNAMQGLQAITEKPDAHVQKHVEYMLTWYSLSATVLALWIGLNLKFSAATTQTSAETAAKNSPNR
jgi:surfeit locus 1 family protein